MGTSNQDAVQVERRDGVGWLTLNRPEVINAVNDSIRRGVPGALQSLDDDPDVRVIVVRGEGPRGFCVGADLKENNPADGAAPSEGSRAVWIEAFDRVTKPVIAAVHGYCLGGGFEVALACDVRVASSDAVFALPETGLGLIPGGGGTQRLPRIIGLGRALDLLVTGDRIDANEAYRIGLVSRLVPAADFAEAVAQLANRIAALPPLATRLVKEAVKSGVELGLEAGLRLERDLFLRLLSTQDRVEAAAAFREKREPVFTGH